MYIPSLNSYKKFMQKKSSGIAETSTEVTGGLFMFTL